jgi:hypothetical protein
LDATHGLRHIVGLPDQFDAWDPTYEIGQTLDN